MDSIQNDILSLKEKFDVIESELIVFKKDNHDLKKSLELNEEKQEDLINKLNLCIKENKELKEHNLKCTESLNNFKIEYNQNIKQIFKKHVFFENYMQVIQVTAEEMGKELNDLGSKIKKDTVKINKDLHSIENRFKLNQSNFELHSKNINNLIEFKERSNITIMNIQTSLEKYEEELINYKKNNDFTFLDNMKKSLDSTKKLLDNTKKSLDNNINILDKKINQNETNCNEFIENRLKKHTKDIENKIKNIDSKINSINVKKLVNNQLSEIISNCLIEFKESIDINKIFEKNKTLIMNELNNTISKKSKIITKQYTESLKDMISTFVDKQSINDDKVKSIEDKFKIIQNSDLNKTTIENRDHDLELLKQRVSQIEIQIIHQMNIIISQNYHQQQNFMQQYVPFNSQ